MSVRGICFQAGVLDDLTHFELEQTAAVAIYHTHIRLEQIYIQSVYQYYFQVLHYIMNTSWI